MKAVAHQNLFPGAVDPEADAKSDGDTPTLHAAPSNTPWSNPFPHRIADDEEPLSAPQMPLASKGPDIAATKKPTRTEQVIAYIREHGPATSAELCRALEIESKGGISPFITPAVASGRIIRVDGKYALPSPTDAPAADAASRASRMQASKAEEPSASRRDDPAPIAPGTSQPDFAVFIDGLQVSSYADGSHELQHGSVRIQIQPHQMRAFLVLAQLRGDSPVVSR